MEMAVIWVAIAGITAVSTVAILVIKAIEKMYDDQ